MMVVNELESHITVAGNELKDHFKYSSQKMQVFLESIVVSMLQNQTNSECFTVMTLK